MPFSSPEGKDVAKRWLHDLIDKPGRVLDVGAGSGTWGKLMRKMWPGAHITALEIHEPYVERFSLNKRSGVMDDPYDEVVVGDARLLTEWAYDLVVFGDVLEHMELVDALSAWGRACAGSPAVLASLPIVEYPQGAVDGNEHERHLVTWSHELAVELLQPSWSWAGNEIGVYLWRRW